MHKSTLLMAGAVLALSACASQPAPEPIAGLPVPGAPAVGEVDAPDLVVVISVDSLSSQLLEEYLPLMNGGLARLSREGTLFLNAYQAHSMTETCPGHATLLTGSHPARSGIIANRWIDIDRPADERVIYCAEDPDAPGDDMVISASPLKVPTLGAYMKAAHPGSRNVSIAGKDRAAVMMGGRQVDQRWWWGNEGWISDLDRPTPPVVAAATVATQTLIDAGSTGLEMTEYCAAKPEVIAEGQWRVGDGRLGWAAGDSGAFRRTPGYDGAVLALGAALIDDMQLGRSSDAPDLISLGLSATDYVSHAFGPDGGEACLQMFSLDRNLEGFLDLLDARELDYAVVLTADHGAPHLPERLALQGIQTGRMAPDLNSSAIAEVERQLPELPENWVAGEAPYDMYVARDLDAGLRAQAIAALKATYAAHPQIEAVFTREEIEATPMPAGNPANWTLLQRKRAGHDPERSGDLAFVLTEYRTPIERPGPTFISHHSSPWDYDRRVPIAFYRPGQAPVNRPDVARTVDILPTLAAHLGLSLGGTEIDGVCLDGVHGKRCGN
ncbi:MAG: alkaline phosphatase family protein [Sphingomonas sp.]|nr:alkaline phosphatase family protein [Sphingomonas sp.]